MTSVERARIELAQMRRQKQTFGVNVDTKARQDFGPAILVPHTPKGSSNA